MNQTLWIGTGEPTYAGGVQRLRYVVTTQGNASNGWIQGRLLLVPLKINTNKDIFNW